MYATLGGFALTGIVGWLIMEYAFKERMQPQDTVEHMPIFIILSFVSQAEKLTLAKTEIKIKRAVIPILVNIFPPVFKELIDYLNIRPS